MAKPDDTRIAHASTNTSSSNTSTAAPGNTNNTNNTNNTSPLPANADLIALLDALRGKLASAQPTPLPPKSARPTLIKPRRRVTVSTSVTAANAEPTPWIRLCGNWLVPAGFNLQTKVRVHVAKGFLLLIPEAES